jgi:SpoVK/Ycf46/Vps4 family AAA+-type ATPase
MDYKHSLDEFADEVQYPVGVETGKKKEDEYRSTNQWTEISHKLFMPVGRTSDKLVTGLYEPVSTMRGVALQQLDHTLDDLIIFRETVGSLVINEIKEFWSRGDNFKKQGFLHKRGYMLYGPPGGGKTAIVQQMISDTISADGIVLMCTNPWDVLDALSALRSIESIRNLLCVFEDIDATIHRFGDAAILSVLDGERQTNHTVNLATTNYPERLEKRIVGRPRRFDRVVKIGMPNLEVRFVYLSKKLGGEPAEVMILAKQTEDFSFAALAELVISIKCLDLDTAQTIKRLKEMQDLAEELGKNKE